MNRLHKDINALSKTKSHEELVASLQKILRTMTFYISQSEGVILEQREQWHDEYTDALYEDAASRVGPVTVAPTPAERGPSSERRGRKHRDDRSEDYLSRSGLSPDERLSRQRQALTASSATRGIPSNIPDSLKAILNGTHPSFREEDNY